MAINPAIDSVADRLAQEPRSGWLATTMDFVRRRPLGAIGGFVVVLMLVTAAGAGVLAPYDPVTVDFGAMLARPSAAHWLGTDAFGRDLLSRLIYGSRTALLVGFAAALLGASLGAIIGVASAYFGGRIDLIMQRVVELFLAFPIIILALAVVSILGTGVG